VVETSASWQRVQERLARSRITPGGKSSWLWPTAGQDDGACRERSRRILRDSRESGGAWDRESLARLGFCPRLGPWAGLAGVAGGSSPTCAIDLLCH
jgi:hypothetical protein